MKSGLFLLAAAFTVALAIFAKSAESSVSPPKADKARVIVMDVKKSDDTRRLLVPAKVEARVASTVTADAEGLVTVIKKPLGSAVKAGEVVLYLENKDPAFTFAKVPVRAPVSGVVSQMAPTLMSHVSHGDRLFVVMNAKELKLTAEIPGSDLSIVQPGAKGVFKQNLDDKEGAAIQVAGLSPMVDPRTGTASAELAFEKTKGKQELPAIGSVGHALFETSRGQILMIPESALTYVDGKPVVRILDANGAVQRKPVELGEQKESQLVVKSGLEVGEKLIVRVSRSVKDGEAVDVEQSEPKKN